MSAFIKVLTSWVGVVVVTAAELNWVVLDWEKDPGEERRLVFPEEEPERRELKKLDDDL